MEHLIACRIQSYGPHRERGWSHLPEIGLRHVEVKVPADAAEADVLRQRLDNHGLTASSFQGEIPIAEADVAERVRPQLATCAAFGTRYLFVSVKAGEVDPETVHQRLRAVGDVADEHDVTVVMETHPDLMTNGDVARQHMEAIDHPRIRVNFDTANILFYNQGLTPESELEKVIDYVAAVHLKDSTGAYQTFDFPALGRGIVDLPRIFGMLDERGFTGPYTMELEGTAGVEFDEPTQLQYVADSVQHLRDIGALR